jgi:hypothetical protein
MITKVKELRDVYTGEVNSLEMIKDDITFTVPKDLENSDYAEIMRQVEAGELTIQEADSE